MRTWTVVMDAIAPAGRRHAAALAARGKNLVLIGDARTELEVVSSELRVGHRVDVRILAIDLSQPSAADAVVRWLRACELTIDGFVAVRRDDAGSCELHEQNVERIVEAFLPAMRSLGFGSVVRVEERADRLSTTPPPPSSLSAPRERRITVPGHRDPSARQN